MKTVFLYSHGFPDASVATDALAAAAARSGAEPDDNRLYASAVPRKWGDALLSSTSAAAFVCFNARGVPGSGGDFYTKTLTVDIDDLELVPTPYAVYGVDTHIYLAYIYVCAILLYAL